MSSFESFSTTQTDRISHIVTHIDTIGDKKSDNNHKIWFGISIVAFVLLYGLFGIDILGILIFVGVLFVHELGHFLTMRMFGYKDTRIVLLPFGAITFGRKEYRKAFEEYIIYMAGPLPGMLIGIWMLWNMTYYDFDVTSLNIMIISMLIIINYVNLLPIYPLDGGRVVQLLFLLRYPRLQFYFYVLSLCLLLFVTIYYQDWLLLIFVGLLAIGFRQNHAISRVIKSITIANPTKEDVAKAVLNDSKYTNESLDFQSNVASLVWYIIHIQKPSKKLIAFGGLFYFVMLLSPVIVVSVLVYNTSSL